MSKPKKKQLPPATSLPSAYPEVTTGSQAAESNRRDANKWSEETRENLFQQGMQIIYGGTGPKSAKFRS